MTGGTVTGVTWVRDGGAGRLEPTGVKAAEDMIAGWGARRVAGMFRERVENAVEHGTGFHPKP
jgi:hypothetical protein